MPSNYDNKTVSLSCFNKLIDRAHQRTGAVGRQHRIFSLFFLPFRIEREGERECTFVIDGRERERNKSKFPNFVKSKLPIGAPLLSKTLMAPPPFFLQDLLS